MLKALEARRHMDRLSTIERSALMRRVRQSGTKPELAVRRALHALGYRCRLSWQGLPGRPDIIFTKRRMAILVHGCFWHQHPGCRHATVPGTRTEYWVPKFQANRSRDERLADQARALGWDYRVIWECETRDPAKLRNQLISLLGPAVSTGR